jgi:hypothetical protein
MVGMASATSSPRRSEGTDSARGGASVQPTPTAGYAPFGSFADGQSNWLSRVEFGHTAVNAGLVKLGLATTACASLPVHSASNLARAD